MVTLASPAQRAELLAGPVHCQARLYRIARKDGFVVTLTSHSAPIKFDGLVYAPSRSANASASVARGGLGESSLDASGAISSDLITEADLRAGRYRGAEVLEVTVDYRFPFIGALEVARYWIEGTRQDGLIWQAKCTGITARLGRRIGRFLERNCWKEFGDLATCKYDTVPASSFYAPISHVLSEQEFRVQDLGSTKPAGHFAYGLATWRKGANEGLSAMIQAYDNANQLVTLAVRPPMSILVGDRVDLIVGCDRSSARCAALGNGINFGGLKFLPVADEQIKPATL